jgi:hypothetical protein
VRKESGVTKTVVFEKKNGNGWEPVSFDSLQPGDITRMKDTHGAIIDEECRVSKVRSTDPDTSKRYDLMLEPLGG